MSKDSLKQKIVQLLTLPTNGSGSALDRLKQIMKLYIATPWSSRQQRLLSLEEYETITTVVSRDKTSRDQLCKQTPDHDLCQSHAGNLFEHSQWAALQMLSWFKEKHPLVAGLDETLAVVSAFFHDVGKGGDCIYNMYDSNKYNGKGDRHHPNECARMILGEIPFQLDCPHADSIFISDLIQSMFPTIDLREVALAAQMHWEFGVMNFPNQKSIQEKARDYIKSFQEACAHLNIEPQMDRLRLCIAVSCADISAGTNRRLGSHVQGIQVARQLYTSSDPWVRFGMDKKFMMYYDAVINEFL